MACIVKNSRLQGVLDLISALVADPDLNIKTYDDVVNYFAANVPEISEVDIGQALIPLDSLRKDEITKTLKNTKDRLKTLNSAVDRLNDILSSNVKTKKKGPTNEMAKELADIVKDIRKLAGIDLMIPPEAYGDIVSRLEHIGILQDAYFSAGDKVSESHIKRAVEHLRQIKKNARIDEIDKKIEELNGQIGKINSDDVNFEDIENLDFTVRFDGLDREIALKELELGEKRVEFDLAMDKARRMEKAKGGIGGIKTPAAVRLREMSVIFKESVWEPFRALKFMADISAWGVQAAPVVYSMLADVNIKQAFKQKRFGAAFESHKLLGKVFYETTAQVIVDGVRESSKWGKKSKSTLAKELYNKLREQPSFIIAKKAKLQLSESRSLTRSEEVFTSNLINGVPLMGTIKDISEDTMVSTLNALRMIQFNKFYEATGGTASLEQYEKVAELINKMTGTSSTTWNSKRAEALGFILSAPKLFLSRLQLFTTGLPKALSGLDLPAMAKHRKFMFQTEADRFIFREYMKMARGYGAITFLASLIPGVDFEEDPTETHFLRYRVGDIAVDGTGGVGTLYRTIAKAYMLTVGVPSWASYTTKDKLNYLENVQKQGGLDTLLKGFVKYKLHPTVTGAYQVLTGEDFFGNSFRLVGKEGVAPHLEGIARAILPISFETAIDDTVSIYEGDANLGEVTASTALQAIGFNTFRYNTKMADLEIEEYLNDIEYRPRTAYPKFLQNADGDPTKEYYRDKYRKVWSDILGDMIKARGASKETLTKEQVKVLNGIASKRALVEFEAKYGEGFRSERSK